MVADELARGWGRFEPLMPTCNYDEQRFPSSVTINSCPDIDAQVAQTITNLEIQMKAYPDEYLGVLCPNREALRSVSRLLLSSKIAHRAVLQSGEEGYVPFDAEKPVCICTVYGAKGLEWSTTIILPHR